MRFHAYWAGCDPARRSDYFAFVIIGQDGDNPESAIFYVLAAEDSQGPAGTHYTRWAQRIHELHRYFRFDGIACDATGTQDMFVEMLRTAGIPLSLITPVNFDNKTKRKLIEMANILFKQGRLKLTKAGDKGRKLFEQILDQQSKESGVITKYFHSEGAHDDLLWAMLLALSVAVKGKYKGLDPLLGQPREEVTPRSSLPERRIGHDYLPGAFK